MKPVIPAFVFVVLTAAPLFAQSSPTVSVRGVAGVSFFSEPGGVFSGTVGIRLTDSVQAVGELGHLTNMLPRQIQRDVDDAAGQIGSLYGGGLSIDLKAPALYAFGGVRWTYVAIPKMRIFVEGGTGAARGTSDITAHVGNNDVSREVTAILRLKQSLTRPLVAIGGGLSIPLSDHLSADVGYRFMRIFTEDPRINTGTMTAGFGWSF